MSVFIKTFKSMERTKERLAQRPKRMTVVRQGKSRNAEASMMVWRL